MSPHYAATAEKLLALEFSRINIVTIRNVLKECNRHYAPARKALHDAWKGTDMHGARDRMNITVDRCRNRKGSRRVGERMENGGLVNGWFRAEKGVKKVITTCLMVTTRSGSCQKEEELRCLIPPSCHRLLREFDWAWDNIGNEDSAAKKSRPNTPGEVATTSTASTDYECPICFMDVSIASCLWCVQSSHAFCRECVRNHAKQVAYGQGRPVVDCLSSDCNSPFSHKDLVSVLDEDTLKRLEERSREENLNAASIEGLERCKHCQWGVVLEVDVTVDKVFRCGGCLAETCRQCGLDWDDDHMGVPCREMEKDEAATAR